jgi:ATP-dependent Clp protease ATP-binding subunit ClpC
MKTMMMEETKRLFTPEFLNRLDEIVVFKPLQREHILSIIDIAMEELLEGMKEREISIQLSSKAKTFLADKGFDPLYGARQVKRTLRKYIEDPIAEELLKGRFTDGCTIQVRIKKDALEFAEMQQTKSSANKVKKPKEVDSESS